jgi:hypothetical protein
MTVDVKDAVVEVAVSIGDAVVSQQGFGTPLILSETIRTDSRLSTFTAAADMITAGYLITDREYLMAKATFEQKSKDSKSVKTVKVGRKLSDSNAIEKVVFDLSGTAGTFTVSISKEGAAAVVSGAIDYDDGEADVEIVLDAMANVASTTVTFLGTIAGDKKGFTVEFETADANLDFEITAVDVSALTTATSGTPSTVAYGSAVETWSAAYAAVKAVDNDFYIGLAGTETKADILELAALTSAEKKLFYYLTRDADAKAGTADNVLEELDTLGYDNQIICYNETASTYANCAQIGATLPDDLHAINSCYYPLVGITGDDLTASDITVLTAYNVNLFLDDGTDVVMPGTYAGQSGDQGGLTTSGAFIKNVASQHFLEARINEGVYALIKASKVIPFDQFGSFILKTKIESLAQIYGVQENIITAGTVVVTMPDLDSYDSVKKAARWFDGILGDGSVSGAISKISIAFKLAT